MKTFANSIPEVVLQNPATAQFVEVLDKTNEYKRDIMATALRANSFGVLTDRKVIHRHLADFGISLPFDYPMEILMQVLLNADTFCGTRGSKIGLEFFLSVLTLGEVTIDDSNFYKMPDYLILDSLTNGYVAEHDDRPYFNLISDESSLTATQDLGIVIESKYFNGSYPDESAIIEEYLTGDDYKTIKSQLWFTYNLNLTIEFQTRSEFYYHNLLNKYFVWAH